ncbi:MAG: tRNA pseudouridine(13) synthase TruD [Gammaproteobacteria bacterium]|nr:tRNA pseudouridine(13) synthase TruD [Gammaproteobacteria bacterium]
MAGSVPKGILRDRLSDFKVCEVLDFEFADEGEHLYLQIEKTNLNTQDVQKLLAGHYGVDLVDVSYAGMKDKRAIARQWFSVRLPKTTQFLKHSNVVVLKERRHTHKLRIGAHAANKFNIVVRETSSQGKSFAERAFARPFPNYFGSQRFGRNFRNLQRACEWVTSARVRTSRAARSRHLSTLRSFIFNEVLAMRVCDGTWNSLICGDVQSLSSPTGPLWGRGSLPTAHRARENEESIRSKHRETCDALEWVGLRHQRRALSAQASDVEIDGTDSTVSIGFTLPPGCYATVAIGECFELEERLS